jgi:catechol 2,3-dioxygenase-like lactoylglutathione lyase family enzyme
LVSAPANFENPAMSAAHTFPTFTGMPFFVYPVADIARSRAFYGGLLGLTEIASWEDQFVEYAVGDAALALSTTMRGAIPGVKGGAAALDTDRFDDAVALLRAAGVRFALEPIDTGVCMIARFEDPDGNHLVLHRKHDP